MAIKITMVSMADMVDELTNVAMVQSQAMVVNARKVTTLNIARRENLLTIVTETTIVIMATQLLSS
jgi:hypothetical protein